MTIEQRLSILEKRIGIREAADSSYAKATKEELSKFKNYVTKFLKKKPANEEEAFNKWYKEVYKNVKVKESIQKVNGNRIRVYDNGGEDAKNGTLDRITVVFLDFEKERNGSYQAVAASETGSGFYQHTSAQLGRHLGKEISFSDLNPRLQKMIKNEFEEVNESTKRPRKKVIESYRRRKLIESVPPEVFWDFDEDEQLDCFCEFAEAKFGFNLEVEYLDHSIICSVKNNPKIEEMLDNLEDCINSFNSLYETDYTLIKKTLTDTTRYGECYKIST